MIWAMTLVQNCRINLRPGHPTPNMSLKARSIKYGVAGLVLSIAIIACASLLAGSSPPISSTSTSQPVTSSAVTSTQSSQSSQASVQPGTNSLLVVQLTDPPSVPTGTLWLNLTYSSLGLLVGEPSGSGGQLTPQTITVTPKGGSATLDLLGLQNVSQTIASASVPDGSTLYSVTFTVSSISIDVDGTVSPVALATNGNTFTVTMANVPVLHGTNLALLQLSPVVVNSPDGYTLVPSSVGVLRQSEGQGESNIGWRHNLSNDDTNSLMNAKGSLSANLLSLTTSGTTTTLTVQVTNTGSVAVNLVAIGMTGQFSVQGGCGSGTSTTTTSSTTSTTSTTSTSTGWNQPWTNQKGNGNWQKFACFMAGHWNILAFVPVIPTSTSTTTTSTTSTATCGSGELNLLSQSFGGRFGGLSLSPGECVNLTYTGTISFGDTGVTIVPTTTAGTVYHVYVMATNGANLGLMCTLGTPISCTPQQIEAPMR